MAADDFLNAPQDQGFPADLDSSSMSGNRPASGARRATPGEVLSQGFQGAQNAGDFLGLDTEFAGSQDPSQSFGGGTPLDLATPPSTYAPDPNQAYAPQEPAPMPAGDPVQEFAEAPSAFEFGEDLGSDDLEGAASSAAAGSKRPALVAALLLAGLAAGGYFYGPTLYTRYFPKSEEVARGPGDSGAKPKATHGEKSAAVASPAGTETSAPAAEAAQETKPVANAGQPSSEPAAPRASSKPRPEHNGEAGSSRATDLPTEAKDPAPSGSTPDLVAAPTPQTPDVAAQKVGFPNLGDSSFQWASEDQLELIWRGADVPLEALNAPAKTLMPRVGNVRVFTHTGDVFEGRLYAIGQGLVWLVGEGSRIGLDGARVEHIEVLPPQAAGLVTSESQVAGGRRVRVKVPGGMLYGSVLKSEGEDVTLALQDGGRVRVKASDLQDLGPGRAVVVRR